jgi:hypothetical protein
VSGVDYSSLHSILSWTGGFSNIDSAPLTFKYFPYFQSAGRDDGDTHTHTHTHPFSNQPLSILTHCWCLGTSGLFLRNALSTREEFVEQVKRHYAGQVQQQIGRLLGHLSVLGAPLSFVTSLGSSVQDLFSEPSKSVVRVGSPLPLLPSPPPQPCVDLSAITHPAPCQSPGEFGRASSHAILPGSYSVGPTATGLLASPLSSSPPRHEPLVERDRLLPPRSASARSLPTRPQATNTASGSRASSSRPSLASSGSAQVPRPPKSRTRDS